MWRWRFQTTAGLPTRSPPARTGSSAHMALSFSRCGTYKAVKARFECGTCKTVNADMAHQRQSTPDSGLGSQVAALQPFRVVSGPSTRSRPLRGRAPLHTRLLPSAAVEGLWHIQDSQSQIPVLARRLKPSGLRVEGTYLSLGSQDTNLRVVSGKRNRSQPVHKGSSARKGCSCNRC